MCTLGTIVGQFLFKNRDMERGAGVTEDVIHGQGRFRYLGVAGHASRLERGLNSGINEAGVAVAITFVDHIPLAAAIRTRTPRGVMVEEILSKAGDLAAALQIATQFLTTTPLVGGNVVVMTPKGGAVIEQLYPKYAIEILTQGVTVRTNHFLNLQVTEPLAVPVQNSKARWERFTHLLSQPEFRDNTDKPADRKCLVPEIKKHLANHERPHPICRHGAGALTVSTAIYDIKNRSMYYGRGNPCQGIFTEEVL